MPSRLNALGQPIGQPVDNWVTPSRPSRSVMDGHYCRLEPIDTDRHAPELYAAFSEDTENRIWTYMASGPFPDEASFREWMSKTCLGDDPLFYAIVDKTTGKAAGCASFLRIAPAHGVIEVGNITFSPLLRQTSAATEAMFLMMQHVFSDLGYRRFEWKCDHLNAASRRAAERLGFSFEGIFRQAIIYKGRNRDTAWYSIIDREWPVLEQAFTAWLDSVNFDSTGCQKMALGELIAGYRMSDQTE